MVFDRSCPGAQTIRQPRPEFIDCTNCGSEVEIWTDELKATCSKCGEKLFRAQQASCIDWCPHAKECVGPEVYARLKAGVEEDLEEKTPLDIFTREHERTLDNIGLLRAASLCIKLGTLSQSLVLERGIDHLTKVLEYLDKDVRLHFRREEDVLFPALEKHIGVEKSPTRLLLDEHKEIWQYYEFLRGKLAELREDGSRPSETTITEVEDTSSRVERLIREHIKKEEDTLLPLAKRVLGEKELEEIAPKLRSVSI